MNGFKVVLEIAIAFVIGTGILTLINWKTAQTELATSHQWSAVQLEGEPVNLNLNG